MKFHLMLFYKTALIQAVEKRNLEAVQILLDYPEIDVNMKSISNINFFFISFRY